MSENTNSEPQIAIDHLVGIALADPDDEGDCLWCHRTMTRPDRSEGQEAGPLCHPCAQAVALVLAGGVRRLREREATLTAERDEARAWVRRITAAERVLTCVYCGEAYPPGTPDHGADVLTAHVRVCAKHPMRETEAEVERLRKLEKNLKLQREVLGRSVAELSAEVQRLRDRDADWQRATMCSDPDAFPIVVCGAQR